MAPRLRAGGHFYPAKISVALWIGGKASSTARWRHERHGAVKTELQRRLIAGRRQLDGLAGQCGGFAIEQQLGRPSRPVRGAARPPCRIAGPALGEPPAPVPRSLSPCFISSRSGTTPSCALTRRRHRRFLNGMECQHYSNFSVVAVTTMKGLVPSIHIFERRRKGVNAHATSPSAGTRGTSRGQTITASVSVDLPRIALRNAREGSGTSSRFGGPRVQILLPPAAGSGTNSREEARTLLFHSEASPCRTYFRSSRL
jgi:hypothetical protein